MNEYQVHLPPPRCPWLCHDCSTGSIEMTDITDFTDVEDFEDITDIEDIEDIAEAEIQ